MTSTTVAAADLLDKAADAIQERGWGQNKYSDESGNHLCFLGCVSYAKVGRPTYFEEFAEQHVELFVGGNTWEDWLDVIGQEDPVLRDAILAFEGMIIDELSGIDYRANDYTVVVWNDRVASNGQEVIEKLRAAALLLRAKAETATEQKELVTA